MRTENSIAVPIHQTAHARALKWSVISRERSKPHYSRKLYHMAMGLMCFALYAFVLDRVQALWILSLIGGVWITLDILRIRFPKVGAYGLKVFGKLMRREELKSLSGNTFFIIGLIFVTLFFPKPIVLLSVLYLAIGDPVAAMIGSRFGKIRLFGKKSLEGALANFGSCLLATLIVGLAYFNLSLPSAITLALIGGLVATLSELLPLPMDDNFTIPVLSAVLLTLALNFIPIF